ncbi:hypothetical protein [Bowmanella denitrificans]|uniref:hypothetical protein n=1 Tax=Bowmanella denitrificans TaxID=366582 RepID=UPI000C9AB2A9|nr:hypothetical protein [Bowmanella denitrificans]
MKFNAKKLLALPMAIVALPIVAQQPDISGFDCADEVLEIVHLLGRGETPAQFVPADVQTELNRQHQGSELKSIRCTDAPELKASTAVEEGTEKQILTSLSMTFPVEATVSINGQTVSLKIDQQYLAENLDQAEGRKVTQKFIVKQ